MPELATERPETVDSLIRDIRGMVVGARLGGGTLARIRARPLQLAARRDFRTEADDPAPADDPALADGTGRRRHCRAGRASISRPAPAR